MNRGDHRDAFFRDDAERQRLKEESTMTLNWLAQGLAMGSANRASHCLRFR
jgi:D-alanyl-D-alanine carboxypeptidase